jgi:hypothetical protein
MEISNSKKHQSQEKQSQICYETFSQETQTTKTQGSQETQPQTRQEILPVTHERNPGLTLIHEQICTKIR